MKLYNGLLFIAVCLLTAHALPNSMQSDESSINSGESDCSNAYSQAQQYTNQQVAIQTNACLHPVQFDPNSDPQTLAQVQTVRSNLTTLQTNLANCIIITDNLEFVTCVANNNDVNQHLLNNANQNAQNAEGALNNSQENNKGSEKTCISHVLSKAKTNLTNAANTYNKCLQTVLQE